MPAPCLTPSEGAYETTPRTRDPRGRAWGQLAARFGRRQLGRGKWQVYPSGYRWR
jgi:hypothetical protein